MVCFGWWTKWEKQKHHNSREKIPRLGCFRLVTRSYCKPQSRLSTKLPRSLPVVHYSLKYLIIAGVCLQSIEYQPNFLAFQNIRRFNPFAQNLIPASWIEPFGANSNESWACRTSQWRWAWQYLGLNSPIGLGYLFQWLLPHTRRLDAIQLIVPEYAVHTTQSVDRNTGGAVSGRALLRYRQKINLGDLYEKVAASERDFVGGTVQYDAVQYRY